MRCRQSRLPVYFIAFLVTMVCGTAFAAVTPVRVHASSIITFRAGTAKATQPAAPILGERHAVFGRSLSADPSTAAAPNPGLKTPIATSLDVLAPGPAQNPNYTALLTPGLNSYLSEPLYPYQLGFQFSVEPPDPSLCLGGGKVIQTVELAITISDSSGNTLAGPTDLYTFFGSPNVAGKKNFQDIIGLVRCYYDSPTSTFFFVATDVGNKFNSPAFSALLIAVMPSTSTTPTTIVTLPTTDNGGSSGIKHKHCPCYEDQPLIGADANGLYISGNEFPLNPLSAAYNGGQIYAFNKADLIAGSSDPGVIVFEAPNELPSTGKKYAPASSIQPAIATDGVFATANNGTEYFLSALDFSHKLDNRVAVWAITNTCGIPGSGACASPPNLTSAVLPSNVYGIPPDAVQEKGYAPLGAFCFHNGVSKLFTLDDRMQQVIFADGQLYSAVTTIVTVNKKTHSGLLYFVVLPSVNGGTVGATITDSNYVASDGLDLFYPAVAATNAGSAVMTFSFSGKTAFPSVGYIPLTTDLGTFTIHTGVSGAGPYDAQSAYRRCYGLGTGLWGLNSAAVAENNTLWMATEYVSATCNLGTWLVDPTCGKTRGLGSNWGIAVTNLAPPGGP